MVPPEREVDPGGRDGCRAPVPWTAEAPHGWAGAEPWLPWPPDPGVHSVAAEREDPSSVLHLYRRLLAERHGSPALTLGGCALLDAADGVLAYERVEGEDRRVVVVNFTGETRPLDVPGTVRVASDGVGEGGSTPAELGPDRALVIEP